MAELYLVDANVLIEAANRYYRFETVPGFWEWLEAKIGEGTVRTVTMVAEEVESPPPLVDWVKQQKDSGAFCVDVSDEPIQASFREIASWIVNHPFGPAHIAKFLDGADPWIIAAARVRGATVVTQEVPAGDGAKKIKIPDVCKQYDVRCINTFDLTEELQGSF